MTSLPQSEFQKTIIEKWVQQMEQYIQVNRRYFEKESTRDSDSDDDSH